MSRAEDISDHTLPLFVRPAEKRALDLISNWPWIGLGELAALMGVSPQRASQAVIPLEGFRGSASRRASGTVAGDWPSPIGASPSSPAGTAPRSAWRNGGGASPSKTGMAPSSGATSPAEGTASCSGTSSNTAAVHGFLAALAAQAPLLGWEIVQLDPLRRASRHFRHDGGMRAVNPDAFGVLTKGDTRWSFFLEWERRAVRPSTMSARLAPYLRYFSSLRPTDDHGVRPAVLVVFDDDIAATHFLHVAREEMRPDGVTVPLWVSHREAIDALGPLGRAWRAPTDWESPQPLPPPSNYDRTVGA